MEAISEEKYPDFRSLKGAGCRDAGGPALSLNVRFLCSAP